MFNSSALCRQQEAHHRRIAAETDLQNVRKVALAAARAWEVQALEAENREAGSKDALSNEDAAIVLEFLLENEADMGTPTIGWMMTIRRDNPPCRYIPRTRKSPRDTA
jgi:hypothetical protein